MLCKNFLVCHFKASFFLFIASLLTGRRGNLFSCMSHPVIANSEKHCLAIPFLVDRKKTRLLCRFAPCNNGEGKSLQLRDGVCLVMKAKRESGQSQKNSDHSQYPPSVITRFSKQAEVISLCSLNRLPRSASLPIMLENCTIEKKAF